MSVVKEEGPWEEALFQLGVRAVVCECPISFVDWGKVSRAVARFSGAYSCGDW